MNKKMMIVEDDLEILQLLHTVFLDEFDITLVQNGKKALDVASNLLPDLIILDIQLPCMNGIEICKRLKADSRTVDTKIVMLTGMVQDSDHQEALLAGADEFVTKPFSMTDFVNTVRTVAESTP